MDADKTRASDTPAGRKPASAQDIKVTTSESTFGLEAMAWLEVHKKQLVAAVAVIVVAIIGLVIYQHYVAARELSASEALLALRPPIVGAERTKPVPSEKFMKVVEEYSGTAAARRALLLAADALFEEAKYDQARSSFEQFLRENPGDPLSCEADLGIATCLEVSGKQKEALEAYDMVRKRYPQEAGIVSEAKLGIGRIYESQGKLEQAYNMYKELYDTRFQYRDSWAQEATERLIKLDKEHPELAKLNMPPPPQPKPPTFVVTNRPATNLILPKAAGTNQPIRLLNTKTPAPLTLTNKMK